MSLALLGADMLNWLKTTNSAATLLAGVAILCQLALLNPAGGWLRMNTDSTGPEARNTGAATSPILEQCMHAATLLHDIHWASACMVVAEKAEASHAGCLRDPLVMGNPKLGEAHCEKQHPRQDDSPECTLPLDRAASLNTLLKESESRCFSEASR